jgi:methylthioribose-1-phosphate isomerase
VAALSLAVQLHVETHHRPKSPFSHPSHVADFVHDKLEYLKTSRPTAVNLFEAAKRLDGLTREASHSTDDPEKVVQVYLEAAQSMLQKDVEDNQNIGKFGAQWLMDQQGDPDGRVTLLTHCNTGSLATAGWVLLFFK